MRSFVLSLLSVLMIYLREKRISPGSVLLMQLSLPTFGFFLLQEKQGAVDDGWIVSVAPFLIGVGIILHKSDSQEQWIIPDKPWLKLFLRDSAIILFILAAMHFSITGITLFSDQVEIDRFSSGSSGFGGFPSRAVLFGIPALALISLATVTAKTRNITVAIWVLFVVSNIFLGFKGAILEALFLALTAYLVRVKYPKARHIAAFAVGLVIALLYVFVVQIRYATSGGTAGGLQYIFDRSTTQAIESGYLALLYAPSLGEARNVFIDDMGVLIRRYLGLTDGYAYTFDWQMSSIVTGTPLGPANFIVPVTVGGAVYLIFSLGVPMAAFALVLIGMVWTKATQLVRSGRSAGVLAAGAVTLMGLRMFLMNGNGAYVLINLSFTFLILLVCIIPSCMRRTTRHLYRPRPRPPMVPR